MGSFAPFVTILAAVNIGAIVCVRNDVESIDHLQILARHGERNPLFPVPELGEFTVSFSKFIVRLSSVLIQEQDLLTCFYLLYAFPPSCFGVVFGNEIFAFG